jgi:hypothetical protein
MTLNLPLPPPKGDRCVLSPFVGGRGRSCFVCLKTMSIHPFSVVMRQFKMHQNSYIIILISE